jgi:phenylacetate-CoA ligase
MSGPVDLQRRFYDMLMESQYWSAERMQQHQRTQLAQLLRHAKANVPFYGTRLDAVLKPNGDVDWDLWNEIPVVTRSDLQDHREAMQAKELPNGHGLTVRIKSSGSTGIPVETTHTQLEAWAGSAALLRALRWHSIDFDKSYFYFSGEDPNVAAWPEGKDHGAWGPPWDQGLGARHQLNNLTAPEKIAVHLANSGYSYASAMPSRLEPVAYALDDMGMSAKLSAIFTRGEAVTPTQRRLFDRMFGASIVETYGAEETFRMAHSCPDAAHYHVHEELGLVEIVGEDGKPVAEGQQGEVIVTPFYNTAQPLVRYALGDLAVPGAACKCGRTLAVIERIVGRTYHLFQRADGSRFVPIVLEDASFELGLGMWQLAQVAPDKVEFRYVMRTDRVANEGQISSMVRAGLPPSFHVKLVRLDRFSNTNGSKHILLQNEMSGN